MTKRLFDIAAAVCVLTLVWPVMLMEWAIIMAAMGSPALFRQTRPGYRGKPFVMYKFRTMNDRRDEKGELAPDHARLTPVGRLIRRLSLDEMPQLFNVLKGDMSIVGPRPLLMEYLPLYSPEQARRHEVRPGITGWAQINGRNEQTWAERFRLDVWYVDNHSLALDLKILWRTIGKALSGEGVNQEGSATRDKFKGNIP